MVLAGNPASLAGKNPLFPKPKAYVAIFNPSIPFYFLLFIKYEILLN